MLLLAIDTSTAWTSVAVLRDGEPVADAAELATNRHGDLLAPLLTAVLRDAGSQPGELTAVAAGVGPGPFTGLRVGMATAAALGHACGIPVHGVVSHDAIAAATGGPVVAVTDARRREVYWARYDEQLRRVEGPEVTTAAVLAGRLTAAGYAGPLAGPGVELYPDALAGWLHKDAGHPAAVWIGRLAVAGHTVPLVPRYLRRPDAVEPGPRRPALPRR